MGCMFSLCLMHCSPEENGPNVLPRQGVKPDRNAERNPRRECGYTAGGPGWHSPLVFRSNVRDGKWKDANRCVTMRVWDYDQPPASLRMGLCLESCWKPRLRGRPGWAPKVQWIRFWLGRAALRQRPVTASVT